MAEIVNETRQFILGTDGVTYFQVYTVDYDDETQTVDKTRIGPIGQLVSHFADKFEQNAQTLASNSQVAALNKKRINEINGDNTEIQTITGFEPLKEVQARYLAELTTPGWTIDDGTGGLPLVFSENNQGVLKYSINGAATKNAIMYGAAIRLINYTGTTNVDFFAKPNGNRYFSLPDANIIIKKP